MHRAALALAVSARFAQNLRHHLVVVFLLGFGCFRSRVAMRVGMTMAAVSAGDQVSILQRTHRANRHSFGTGIKMRSTLQNRLAEQIGNIIFQRADLHHLAQVTSSAVLW